MMNGKDDILSAAGKAQMKQPANAVSPNYGFGWFIDSEKGLVFHSGAKAIIGRSEEHTSELQSLTKLVCRLLLEKKKFKKLKNFF